MIFSSRIANLNVYTIKHSANHRIGPYILKNAKQGVVTQKVKCRKEQEERRTINKLKKKQKKNDMAGLEDNADTITQLFDEEKTHVEISRVLQHFGVLKCLEMSVCQHFSGWRWYKGSVVSASQKNARFQRRIRNADIFFINWVIVSKLSSNQAISFFYSLSFLLVLLYILLSRSPHFASNWTILTRQ